MGSINYAADDSMDTEEPTLVMVRKQPQRAPADDERTLVDVSFTDERAVIAPRAAAPQSPRPAPAARASAPVWKNAPAKPPRPTPSAPRPRSTPPPLPASVAAAAKRAPVPPLPRAAQLPRARVA